MGFPRELLAEHETLVFELKPHFVALLPSFVWTVLALAAVGLALAVAEGLTLIVVSVAALALWLFLAIPPFLRWRFTLFVLTSDRLITRGGVIAKHSKEIPLERINDVAFNQTILERMLRSGDLLIESAGESGQTRIENVRDPEQVQLAIYRESEKNQNRMFSGIDARARQAAAAVAPPRHPSIPEQIEALARLKDQGVLSDDEFETKKRELLERM